MYKINDRVAVHGFDFNPYTYDINLGNIDYMHSGEFGYITDIGMLRTGQPFKDKDKEWIIIDCRNISDSPEIKTHIGIYLDHILEAGLFLDWGYNVVCCCSAGQSRSNAIALSVLIKYFNMDYYTAYDLVKKNNPVCNIAMEHLDVIKKIFQVGLP